MRMSYLVREGVEFIANKDPEMFERNASRILHAGIRLNWKVLTIDFRHMWE